MQAALLIERSSGHSGVNLNSSPHPPLRDIVGHVQVRLNGALLAQPAVENGWLVFASDANLFAVGKNLIAVRVTNRAPSASGSMLVEKLEVHVHYHTTMPAAAAQYHR